MLRLLRKFGKPFLPLFFVAVFLLVGRAAMELTLPALMSDIVDIGIPHLVNEKRTWRPPNVFYYII